MLIQTYFLYECLLTTPIVFALIFVRRVRFEYNESSVGPTMSLAYGVASLLGDLAKLALGGIPFV
jgi:prolipoprotein diacylglyceryltransferase